MFLQTLTIPVLPDLNFGKSLDPVNQGFASSSGLPVALWHGQVLPFHHSVKPRAFSPRPASNRAWLLNFLPEYFIDVADTGRLHVAAAIFEHVKDQRIFGFAEKFSMDDVLEILRKVASDRKFPDNFSGGSDPSEIIPRDEAEQLLRDLGRPGWVGFEESILANISDVRNS